MNIQEHFRGLKLDRWQIDADDPIKGDREGGQATVLAVYDLENGQKGVFRLLHSRRPVDIKRFQRELKILNMDDYTSPHIVKILDSTKDLMNCWYISERGGSFAKGWRKRMKKVDHNRRVFLAIDVILSFCKALAPYTRRALCIEISNLRILLSFEANQC